MIRIIYSQHCEQNEIFLKSNRAHILMDLMKRLQKIKYFKYFEFK